MQELDSGIMSGARLGRTIGMYLSAIMQILTRPIALLTQALYRTEFGERYFSPVNAVFAAGLILLATLLTVTVGPWPSVSTMLSASSKPSMQRDFFSPPQPAPEAKAASGTATTLIVGTIWALALGAAAFERRVQTRRRYEAKRRWHSYCAGVPRSPRLNEYAQAGCSVAFALLLAWLGQHAFAGLVLVSAAFSHMIDQAARRELWNRVLDTIDAQIEGETIQSAVSGLSKPDSEGYHAAIPAYAATSFIKPAAAVEAKPEQTQSRV